MNNNLREQINQPNMYQQGQPLQGQPMYQQPMQGQSLYQQGQPMQGQPMYGQPMQGQPMYGQPMQSQPMYQQGQPMQGQPMYQPMPGQPIQGQPVYQQGGQTIAIPMLGGKPNAYAINPLEELQYANSAMVKQEVELIEVVSGCETANRYHVYINNRSGVQTYLFKCKERSSWCNRNCCPSNLRPFDMRLKHVSTEGAYNDNFDTYYAGFERPFKCTCCCFCRPLMKGNYHDPQVSFGEIREPFTLFSPEFDVYDKDNIVKWKIKIDCCQCGFCCRKIPWGKLSNVNCQIFNMEGVQVGKILKKSEGLQELISDADTYIIDFPVEASPSEKLTFIGAALLIDYRYYEDDSGDQNKNNGHHHGHHHHY